MDKEKKIILLVCDQFPGILTPDIPSYEWMFEKVYHATFEIYQTWKGELPLHLNNKDIYLITGSNSSAYDNTPWVRSLRDWIRYAFSRGCCLEGICFGHQIIAEALDGKVERSTQGWGIGIRTSHIVDSVFEDIAETDNFTILYDHHDQVVRLPKGSILVSGSDFCPFESFRIGMQVLTFQGHPEFSNDFIRHWINDCAPDEPEAVKAKALRSMDSMENQGSLVASWMLKFWQA